MIIYSLPETRQVVLRTDNGLGYADQETIATAVALAEKPYNEISVGLRNSGVRGWVADQLALALCGERHERWFG